MSKDQTFVAVRVSNEMFAGEGAGVAWTVVVGVPTLSSPGAGLHCYGGMTTPTPTTPTPTDPVIDCVLTEWTEWSCNFEDGERSRQRFVMEVALNGGANCGATSETSSEMCTLAPTTALPTTEGSEPELPTQEPTFTPSSLLTLAPTGSHPPFQC